MTDNIFKITDKEEAAKAYAEANNGDAPNKLEYSGDLLGFLSGIAWYEHQVLGLSAMSPDNILKKILACVDDMELLQCSVILMANAKRYHKDVFPQLAMAMRDRAAYLTSNLLNIENGTV